MIGKTLGHYQISSQLGKGGMGEVYQAKDQNLGRDVAIKMLPEEFAGDVDRVSRFRHEARLLASLNHPNIAAIHGLDESGGVQFLVLELVEGKTLADRLMCGEIPVGQSLALAVQIAAALESAHKKGIIHRDLKPANIMITNEGSVKLLDFGVAKLYEKDAAAAGASTADYPVTKAGVIVGTVAYMSPEQALGRIIDVRSDIFSFGVVFYQMLTGRHPFNGDSAVSVLDAILHRDPPEIIRRDYHVPEPIVRIVLKMLEKDPDRRYQSAHDIGSDLKKLTEGSAGETLETLASPPGDRGYLTAAAAGLKAGLHAAVQHFARVHRPRFVIISAILILTSMGLGVFFWKSRPYRPPPDAVRWFEEGVGAIQDGGYLKASKALSEAVRLDPDFIPASARLAEAYLEMDDPERARNELLHARRRENTFRRLPEVERLRFEAIECMVTEEASKGIQFYRQLLKKAEPAARSAILLDLGRACERAADRSCALESYQRAIQLDPQSPAGWLHLALIHSHARRYEDAAPAFDQAERLFQTASNIEGGTEVHYGRGMMFVDREQFEEADRVLRNALQSAKFTGNIQQQVKILMQLATKSIRASESASAVKLANEALDLARTNGVEILAARALLILGGGWMIKNFDEAEKYYREAFQIAQRNGSPFVEARARLSLASLYDMKGAPERCLAEAQLAGKFFGRTNYQRETFQSMVLEGRAHRQLGNLDQAAGIFQALLDAAGPAKPREEQALLYDALGNVYLVQELYRAAYDAFVRSYEASLTGGEGLLSGYSLCNQASCLWRIGDYRMAHRRLAEAEAIGQKKGLKALLDSIRDERSAMAASERGNAVPAESLPACREKMSNPSGTPDVWRYASSLFSCAETAIRDKEPSLAADWANKALEIYHRASCLDSEWRLRVLLGRAGEAGEAALARSALNRLKSQWAAEDYERYLARPDIRRLSRELKYMEESKQ